MGEEGTDDLIIGDPDKVLFTEDDWWFEPQYFLALSDREANKMTLQVIREHTVWVGYNKLTSRSNVW